MARELSSFGRWISLQMMLVFAWQQGDKAIVGRLLGAAPLGVYQMASRMAMAPVIQVSLVLGTVLFPAYVGAGRSTRRLLLLRSLSLNCAVALPFVVWIQFAADELAAAVLGPQWAEVATPLRLLSAFAALKMIGDTATPAGLGAGRPDLESLRNLVLVATAAATVFPLAAGFGLNGVCLALILGALCSLPVSAWMVRDLSVGASDVGRALVPGLILAGAVLTGVFPVERAMDDDPLLALVLGIASSVAVALGVSAAARRWLGCGPFALLETFGVLKVAAPAPSKPSDTNGGLMS